MKSKVIAILIFLIILLGALIGMILVKSHSSNQSATQSAISKVEETSITDSSEETTSSAESSFVSETQANETSSDSTFGSGDTFDGTEPIIRKMGEELPVDLLALREQGDKPPTNREAFGYWTGKMTFKVNSATLYNDFASTGIDPNETSIDYDDYSSDGYKPFVINMTINNINASANNGDTFYSDIFWFSSKDEFISEDFSSDKTNADWKYHDAYLAYFSAHSDGDSYFMFNLNEGESMDVTLCYYVKSDILPLDNLYLGLVTYSYCHSFGIELNNIEVKN